MKHVEPDGSRWCIVVADDHRADRAIGPGRHPAPVQYCRLGEGATLLQRALHRAAEIVPSSQVLVSAFEENRDFWEPAVWFIRPEKRFVSVTPQASQLSVAAAILSVAAHSTSDVITILPARCYVEHEGILRRAMNHALAELPAVPEGAVTLGMLDLEEGVDEDYLLVRRARTGRSLRVDGFARQPVPWVARRLRQHGALGRLGYPDGIRGRVRRPYFQALARRVEKADAAGCGCSGARRGMQSPVRGEQGDLPALPHSLRWRPSAFQQRVIGVCRSGWSGLKSPQSVARMVEFLSNRAAAEMHDGFGADDVDQAAAEIDVSYRRGEAFSDLGP